jgi:hypothetical protein
VRFLALAVVAVAFVAASPPKSAAANPHDRTNHEVAAALNNLAASLKQPEKPNKHDEPCDPGDNKRSSDLCAQWKAADAAKSAAQAAWWIGAIGTLIGALTLCAAIAAAIFAKLAADHTETGATAAKDTLAHQKETSRRQLRPYAYIGEARLSLPFNLRSAVTVEIKNFGHSPAVKFQTAMRNAIVQRPIGDQARDLEMLHWEDMPTLGPQAENLLHVGLSGLDADDIFDNNSGATALIAHHAIKYEDLDGNPESHDAWFYVDKNTLNDGVVMTLNEWARYHSHEEPEDEDPELDLKGGE